MEILLILRARIRAVVILGILLLVVSGCQAQGQATATNSFPTDSLWNGKEYISSQDIFASCAKLPDETKPLCEDVIKRQINDFHSFTKLKEISTEDRNLSFRVYEAQIKLQT